MRNALTAPFAATTLEKLVLLLDQAECDKFDSRTKGI